ncbi:hypothetical protein AKJ53_00920 [candidate division MSBL1 archaeon SCGC-AAA382F02]|uniref:Sulfatase N-terminal domain-containing protein n=1 Tax=candidate division MSBL1 archaeon SCGC-AAA382F02 TaxID=1698282 RepID=A0A133VII4_9EURY|nr:hypothetical protein AKJ53_00920 [candidate division MSBL1 archaeon SCGC-AAA382F02]
MHFLDSHLPYEPPLNFQKFGRKNIFLPGILGKRIDFWSNWSEKRNHSLIGEKAFSSEEIKIMRDAYDNTLLFADYQIQKIFQMLIKKNLLQNTILIITADHGEMLGESGKFGHQLCLKEPLLHVPLIIYSPKIQQKKETNIIETKDIFNIVLYLSKNGFEISYPRRDYAYGEYKANKQFREDILKLDPKKFTSAEFIRTDKFKLVSYNRGNKKLFRLDGEEIEIDDEETKDIMEELLRRKKTQIEKSRISNTVKDRL